VAVALAALVAGAPTDAVAKRKKNVTTAVINGKRIKFTRYIYISGGGGTVAFQVLAQTPIRRGVFRTLGVACGQWPPASVPGPGAYCTANYTETKIGRQPTIKGWLAQVGEAQVTFDSYDGSLIAGRFHVVMQGLTGEPPITVDGLFRGRVALAAN
jgi:hypothetical protein